MRNSRLVRLVRFAGSAAVAVAVLSALVFGLGRGDDSARAAQQAPIPVAESGDNLVWEDLEFAPGELLVKFEPGTPRSVAESIIAQLGTEVIRNFGDDLKDVLVEAGLDPTEGPQEIEELLHIFWLRIIDDQSVEDTVAEFLAEATVELAIPNIRGEYRDHQPTPNDPWFPDQWNLLNAGQHHEALEYWYYQGAYIGGPGIIDADVDAPQGWDLHIANFGTVDCTSVVVGIVDGGMDLTHPDLAANVLYEVDFGVLPRDDDHGTAVAGVVGAVGNNGLGVAGLCWKASLVSLRVGHPLLGPYIAQVWDAVLFAVGQRLIFDERGPDQGTNFRVLNMSFGFFGDPRPDHVPLLFRDAQPLTTPFFALADAADILITAAAPNDPIDEDALPFGDPPCTVPTPNVICVTASDDDDSLADYDDVPGGPWLPWPAYGATEVDIAAPGDDISTTAAREEDAAQQPASCADGLDNGGDGFTDANEFLSRSRECHEDLTQLRAHPGPCFDGIDNGGDGFTDGADPDCAADPFLEDSPWSCADGIDNGGDGDADGADSNCAEDDPWSCNDGIDNGGDGPSDGADPDCTGAPIEASDGTSFAAPHVAGMAALCWSIPDLAGLTDTQMKDQILRFVDRLPGLAGLVAPPHHGPTNAGGRLRWPCSAELGDAPDSYDTVAGDHHLIGGPGDGPIHWDYGNEWFGQDASTEHNANTPLSLDQDGPMNLVNRDVFDDGNFTYFPPPPLWFAGLPVIVEFDVCSDYIGMPDASGGRYDPAFTNEKVFANGFFDWDANGTFAMPDERIVLFPTNVITELEVPAGVGPGVSPPPRTCVHVTRLFIAGGGAPPWLRWRLDYGEDAGGNVPSLFIQDPLTVSDHQNIATFGEVEDYPLSTTEVDYFPDSVALVSVNTPLGSDTIRLTGPTTVHVDLGSIADDDGDGLEEVQTEIVQMELTGNSALLGPVILKSHPGQPSLGQIEENNNVQPLRLDLPGEHPPFCTSPVPADCVDTTAHSFFDVFFEIEVVDLGLILHNAVPKHMQTTITHKPPAPGETYEDLTVIPLLDQDDNPTGVEVGPTYHTPSPPPTGGIVEIPVGASDSPASAVEGSGSSSPPYAIIAGAAAAAALALAAGGWYARRRWIR